MASPRRVAEVLEVHTPKVTDLFLRSGRQGTPAVGTITRVQMGQFERNPDFVLHALKIIPERFKFTDEIHDEMSVGVTDIIALVESAGQRKSAVASKIGEEKFHVACIEDPLLPATSVLPTSRQPSRGQCRVPQDFPETASWVEIVPELRNNPVAGIPDKGEFEIGPPNVLWQHRLGHDRRHMLAIPQTGTAAVHPQGLVKPEQPALNGCGPRPPVADEDELVPV